MNNFVYRLKDILKAFERKISLVSPRGKIISPIKSGGAGVCDFEDIVIEYVDAVNICKDILSTNKKYILFYKSLGYNNAEIGYKLGISRKTIQRELRWVVRFLKKNKKFKKKCPTWGGLNR